MAGYMKSKSGLAEELNHSRAGKVASLFTPFLMDTLDIRVTGFAALLEDSSSVLPERILELALSAGPYPELH